MKKLLNILRVSLLLLALASAIYEYKTRKNELEELTDAYEE